MNEPIFEIMEDIKNLKSEYRFDDEDVDTLEHYQNRALENLFYIYRDCIKMSKVPQLNEEDKDLL